MSLGWCTKAARSGFHLDFSEVWPQANERSTSTQGLIQLSTPRGAASARSPLGLKSFQELVDSARPRPDGRILSVSYLDRPMSRSGSDLRGTSRSET